MPAFSTQGLNARALFHEAIHHPNLVALWPLNEGSGNALDRCTVNRLDMAYNDTITRGVAMGHFYGNTFAAGQTISIAHNAAVNFERTDSFSFMALVNPNISAAGEILSKWNGTNAGWALGFNATRTWRLLLQNGATNALEVRSTNALANGTAKLLCVTYAGGSVPGSIVMYEDGAAVAMTTVTNTLSATIQNAVSLVCGATSIASNLLSATLAFPVIFNAALTAAEVRRFAYVAGRL